MFLSIFGVGCRDGVRVDVTVERIVMVISSVEVLIFEDGQLGLKVFEMDADNFLMVQCAVGLDMTFLDGSSCFWGEFKLANGGR
jgi:hypothetical protein